MVVSLLGHLLVLCIMHMLPFALAILRYQLHDGLPEGSLRWANPLVEAVSTSTSLC